MSKIFDLVIRGGNVFDGKGGPGFRADIAISDGTIQRIGDVPETAREEFDATGKIVTPGFVDIHTHYDGQATWDSRLSPSSEHGVTTVVMGNCGVGFAPCRAEDRERLIHLMEGVEDIPHPVLAEGLEWNWESFPSYLEALEANPHDIDYACQIPHGALRVFVMGERGAAREAASDTEIAQMATLAQEAIEAGALGFSTSRSLNHRTSQGDPTPSYAAAQKELVGIANGLKAAGAGVLQLVSDFTDGRAEMALLEAMVSESGRPMVMTIAQAGQAPDSWRDMLGWIAAQNARGLKMIGMVCGRPVGVLLGLEATMNPFSLNPVYQTIASLPLAERLEKMRDPAMKASILAAEDARATNAFDAVLANFEAMFILGEVPDYEQPASESLAARAVKAGTTPQDLAYEALLENGGTMLLYVPFLNYANFNLEPSREMMLHPNTILGLGDGGAHVGMICDGSFPTSMLTHWTRDRTRGEKLDLGWVIKAQTQDTAQAFGLLDRGVLEPGYKADVNIIDYEALTLHHPKIAYDLPAGGKRLVQGVTGYVATIVSGEVIARQGVPTGVLPGKLVRGEQAAPRAGGSLNG